MFARGVLSFLMNAKHKRTLESLYFQPVRSDIKWKDVETLLLALGAERSEGRGSRVHFILEGFEAVFHRPHPSPAMNKGAVVSARDFITRAGFKP